MKTTQLAIATFILTGSAIAYAGPQAGAQRPDGLREHHPRAEIRHEVRQAARSGALTKEELSSLHEQRQALQDKARAMHEQGPLTDAQKTELKADRTALAAKTRELATNDVRGEPVGRPEKPQTAPADNSAAAH